MCTCVSDCSTHTPCHRLAMHKEHLVDAIANINETKHTDTHTHIAIVLIDL